MIARRFFLAAAAGLATGLFAAAPTFASEPKAFSVPAFQAAQAAGKSILVEVHADWCSVCARQKPITAKLRQMPAYRDFAFFVVDFDTQKPALQALRAQRQSTMITFKGEQEKARTVGVTDPQKIEDMLKAAL